MTNLKSIPGIGNSSLELLEAAGFSNAESLAKAGAAELAAELERANRILQIAEVTPKRANVEEWIAFARDLTGQVAGPSREVTMPVNYEDSPKVASMLVIAPFAIPLPARVLMEHQLAVADIPSGILLNRYSGDLEVRVEDKLPATRNGSALPAASSNIRIAENGASPRLEFDASRVKSIDVLAGPSPRTQTSAAVAVDERVALLRSPREKTNRGRDPKSRRYIRGVLHSHPLSLAAGAVFTLLLVFFLPIGIISAGLLLLSREVPQHFGWVPEWLLVFPLILPVLGICYLIWSLNGSCRICGQRQFFPRACLKNSKAHHVPGLGYIIPVSIQMLLFKWFRCTYCGTPVRLKK